MFDSINEKLQDKLFLDQAVKLGQPEPVESSVAQVGADNMKTKKKHKKNKSKKNKNKSTIQDPLSIAQSGSQSKLERSSFVPSNSVITSDPRNAECYKKRYPDIGNEDPLSHYQSVGYTQGRTFSCGKNLTVLESQQYLWRYGDLQNQFGGAVGMNFYNLASQQYSQSGYFEKRIADRLPGFEPWLCKDDARDPYNVEKSYTDTCTCIGYIVTGYQYNPITNERLESFEEMREWKTENHPINGTEYVVDPQIPEDPFPKVDKQVWCERRNANKQGLALSYCANEGETCHCPAGSVVQFGKKFDQAKDWKNPMSVNNGNYTLNDMNDTNSIKCDSSSFEQINPLMGTPKGCYCYMNPLRGQIGAVQPVKKYWRNIYTQHNLYEQIKTTEIQASKAEEKAKNITKTETTTIIKQSETIIKTRTSNTVIKVEREKCNREAW